MWRSDTNEWIILLSWIYSVVIIKIIFVIVSFEYIGSNFVLSSSTFLKLNMNLSLFNRERYIKVNCSKLRKEYCLSFDVDISKFIMFSYCSIWDSVFFSFWASSNNISKSYSFSLYTWESKSLSFSSISSSNSILFNYINTFFLSIFI